jgi:hypothetical protein
LHPEILSPGMSAPIIVLPYEPSFAAEWNRFVAAARNGHFLFDRGFMEYHSDRFVDFSLLFFEKERLIGVLPANRNADTVYSHQGLTFGGVVAGDRLGTARMLAVFDALQSYLAQAGVRSLLYKPVPHIYHRRPAEEDLYALFRNGAELVRRDISAAIDYTCPALPTPVRRASIRKAQEANLALAESDEWEAFWELLISVLWSQHSLNPVHSTAEILMLRRRFPKAVRLFTARFPSGPILAGAVIFETTSVAHAQYGSVSEEGRRVRALDALYMFLIDYYRASKRWFDFGISSEQQGRILNSGLAKQKEEFGATAVAYDTYCLPTL